MNPAQKLRRRELKRLSKQHQILNCYYRNQLKSREISKKLKVPIDLVYRTVEYAKRRTKNGDRSLESEAVMSRKSLKPPDARKLVKDVES